MRFLTIAVVGTGLWLGIAPSSAVEIDAVSGGSRGPAHDGSVGYERTGSVMRIRPQADRDGLASVSRRDGSSIRTVSGNERRAPPPRYWNDRSREPDPLGETAAARRGGRFDGAPRHGTDGLRARDRPEAASGFLPGAVEPGAFYGTSGTGGGSSIVVIGAPPTAPASTARVTSDETRSDPRVVDVASARLDRRPYGPGGLDVVYSGTTKIIRLAPGFDRPDAASQKDETALAPVRNGTPFDQLPADERQALVYPDDGPPSPPDELMRARARPPAAEPAQIPVPTPAERTASATAPAPAATAAPAAATDTTDAEPWTEDWMRGCVARYPDFDASLGTYRDESGRRRFCTGEP